MAIKASRLLGEKRKRAAQTAQEVREQALASSGRNQNILPAGIQEQGEPPSSNSTRNMQSMEDERQGSPSVGPDINMQPTEHQQRTDPSPPAANQEHTDPSNIQNV